MSELSERLAAVMDHCNLNDRYVAEITGSSERTVARWRKDEAKPQRESLVRVYEFLEVGERLARVLRPEPAHRWLFSPNPSLRNRKPAELLRDGHYRRVLDVVDALGEGVFS